MSNQVLRESAKARGEAYPKNPVLFKRDSGTPKQEAPAKEQSPAVSTGISKPTGTAGIDVLVSGYTDAQKPEARKLFAQMVAMFEPVAQQLQVPAHDMGSAAAALIAGTYAAYHNETLPNEHFKPLVQQMQAVLAQDANYGRMSSAEKQRMYQVLVGTGMFFTLMQMENAKKPDPQVTAQLQAAGKDFLGKFTRLNPEQLRLDSRGLSLRD
ncbi:MAG: hypothetical protein Q4F13_03690 [Pseudomonadota bacterium]|nr:hypothetical protein [Pseudomonadota bacterium]